MDMFEMLMAKSLSGGGGAAPTLITKDITANGTYSALDDNADGYNPVVVNVPNTYTAADEGKVVSNGALVAQTAYPSTITENGTYNTTENNSVTVSVPSLPTGTDICVLTPVSSGITTSEMYAINIGNATLVFGFFDTTAYGANQIFSYPSSFNFAHTTVCRYWFNAYSGGYLYENYRYSVDTTAHQVSLYRAAGGPTYPLAYYFR